MEKLKLENNLKRSEATDEIKEEYLLGSMIFDEENVILLDIDEFKQLDIIMEELQLLKEDLEVVLSKAFSNRQEWKPIDVKSRVIKLDIEGSPICGIWGSIL